MSSKGPLSQRVSETWKRWEMASFDAPPVAAPVQKTVKPVQAAPDPELLRKEVKRLHDAALASGHAEGYAGGHAQGLEAGTDEGYKAGHQPGYEAGFAAGRASGKERTQQEAAQLPALAQECATPIASLQAEMDQELLLPATHISH